MSRKTYPVRVARTALGIRAQELRTLARKAWWARRWIAAIESLRLGARLGRGRQYAVSGQVTDLRFAGPHVTATVQGSRPRPYTVSLDFTTPSAETLAQLAERLRAQPPLLARMITDDLPTQVEALFSEAGCPLFPVASAKPPYDVKMACSCPDWAKPCKHLAAVLFLLGEEIARRPITLLALRGLDPDDIFPPEDAAVCDAAGQGMPGDIASGHGLGDVEARALLRRLGPVPFWRGVNPCLPSLEKMVARQHPVARAAVDGESIDLREPPSA